MASQSERDLWVMPTGGDRKPWVFLKTSFDEAGGAFSPDGRWVAYMSNKSGRMEIYMRPFVPPGAASAAAGAERSVRLQPDQAGGQWQVFTAGGVYPVWRSDGKELYYLGPSGEMMAAPITATDPTLAPGAPVVLFPTQVVDAVGGTQTRQYDVTRDGRFLINTVLSSAAAPITLLMNWQGGLSAREK